MSDDQLPVPIAPPPGVIKSESPRTAEGRWIDMDKVRFRDGKPEKVGGWTAATDTAMAGSVRTLHAWRDNDAIEYIAAGTYKKLYVVDRDFDPNDITPLRTSGTLGSDPITTTDTSAVVEIEDTAHGLRVGDTVVLDGADAVGGITVDGAYTVIEVVDADNYTIEHSSAATSSANGGGASVTYAYEITIGAQFGAYGLGYGVGPYGESTYGTAREASSLFVEPRVWSLDHFGQVLLATYNVGTLYDWDPSDSNPLTTRAAVVSDAPDDIRAMFVTPERFVIALCEGMSIEWCVQADYTTWTPTSTNTAGIRGVTEGTKLVGGRPLGGGISLIWSDAALYLHQYTGSFLVFDTRLAGRNCGLISPSAAITVGSVAYWMGHTNFFMFSGSVAPIPGAEAIKRHVFDALDPTAGYLCAAMYVAKFNEVWFFYSNQNANEPGLYVIVGLNDYSWAVGTLTRLSGTYFSHGDTRPYWAADDGLIYLHEDGNDDAGVAIDAYCTLAPMGLEKGKRLMEIEGFEPDFHEQSGDVTLTLETFDRIRTQDDTPEDSEEFTVAEDDGLLDPRLSGRYVGLTVRSNTLGGHFRFGTPTAYVKPAGDRR